MRSILIVDDDSNIRQFVALHLREEGYRTFVAENGKEAFQILEKNPCDLAIIDIMMPEIDGYTLTKIIREYYDLPIILLTARDRLEDKEKGFLSGTDDYIVKPFEMKELLFRMQALFRRYDKNYDEIIHLQSTVINRKNYEITVGERSFLLPLKEFELLYFLAAHKGQVFTRERLVERIWGFDYEGDERTIDVHIKRLRDRFKDITDDFEILTVRGVGYKLEEKL